MSRRQIRNIERLNKYLEKLDAHIRVTNDIHFNDWPNILKHYDNKHFKLLQRSVKQIKKLGTSRNRVTRRYSTFFFSEYFLEAFEKEKLDREVDKILLT